MPGINEPVALIRVIEILKPKKRERKDNFDERLLCSERNERKTIRESVIGTPTEVDGDIHTSEGV